MRWCPPPTAQRKTAAVRKTRLAAIEMVHGAAGSSVEGLAKNYWSPVKEGADFDFSLSLSPLEPYRDYITVISDTDLANAESAAAPEVGGDHNRSSAVFLTASHPKRTEGSDIFAGVSIDQIYAQKFGQDTAAAVDAAVHRERGVDLGRLRLRLQLRLLDGDLVGIADDAVPERARSAGRLRAAVRPRRDRIGADHTPPAGPHASSTRSGRGLPASRRSSDPATASG